jgi:peptidoglycan/LPS O-acetylase OafA/YrhL
MERSVLRRNSGIDLLRGLAILLVVVHHTMLRIPLRKTGAIVVVPRRLLMALGYEAVFIFFVVSGFLITANALHRWGSLGGMNRRAFYGRRFARIVPCLAALVLMLSGLDLLGTPSYTITNPDQSLGAAIVAAFGLHLNWYEGWTGYLPGGWDVLWSLSIEEVFYIDFPLAALLARRHLVLLAGLASSLPFARAALASNEMWQEKAYLPGMAAIATGVLAALWVASRRARPATWLVSGLGVAGTLLVGAVLLIEDLIWPVLGEATMLLLTGGTALLIAAFHRGWAERWTSAVSAGWLRSLGRLSYEVYLTHMFVVLSLVGLFRELGSPIGLGWLWFLPAVGLSWLLGMAVAKVLSVPAEQGLRRAMVLTAAERRSHVGPR